MAPAQAMEAAIHATPPEKQSSSRKEKQKMSASEKEKFLHDIDARCPISENLQNATPVSVVLVP